MNVQFGFSLPIFADPGSYGLRTPNYQTLDVAETMSIARDADELGFDSLWVADHLMLGVDDAIVEGWTTLAALAGSTQRAKLGMIHYANLMRHAAMTAKATATLDQISNGRLIHFFHPGARDTEMQAYGLPWPETHEERVAQMIESLEITMALWTADKPLDHDGTYYRLRQAVCNPAPLQQPHPPVWLGLTDPTGFEACARLAQGWNAMPIPKAQLQDQLDGLKAACSAAGRDYDDLEKSYETQILIAPDRDALRERLAEMIPAQKRSDPLLAFVEGETDQLPREVTHTFLAGTPDEVEAQIRDYMDLGFTHFLLWFTDVPRRDGIRTFAAEVMPRFR